MRDLSKRSELAARRRASLRLAWLACLMALCAACGRSDPEQALRASVAELQASIEQRDPAAMQQHLAEDFIGNDGLDRDGARRMAAAYLLRYRSVGVTLGPVEVEMAGAHAKVGFSAVLRGGAERALPDSARIYQVDTGWRLQDGDWTLVSASWTPTL